MPDTQGHLWANTQGPIYEKKRHHLLLFLAYVLALGLGLFVAQKHLVSMGAMGGIKGGGIEEGDTSTVFYVMLVMIFCVHFGLNLLWRLLAHLTNEGRIASQARNNTDFNPRTSALFILAYTVIALTSAEWLMMQSAHPWLSLVLFISIVSAMFMITPRLHGRMHAATLFLHGHICVALFGTSYAIMTHNFAPYYLALTIPVMLLVASFAHQHYTMRTEHEHLEWLPCKGRAWPLVWPLLWAVMLSLIMNYVPSVPLEQTKLVTEVQKTTLEQHSSMSIQASSHDAMERGVVYGFGAKDSHTGAIDCSGWIAEINQKMMRSMNARMGKEVYGEKAKLTLNIGANGGAAGLVLAVKVATGEELRNEDLSPDKVRAGLTIGLDTGVKDWDSGRYAGIDHIVQTYSDPETGVMMVSQSSGGVGVHVMPYADWYAKWGHEAKLYGVDMSLLASPAPVPSL